MTADKIAVAEDGYGKVFRNPVNCGGIADLTQPKQYIETTTDHYLSLLTINGITCLNKTQSQDINQASSNKQSFGGLQP